MQLGLLACQALVLVAALALFMSLKAEFSALRQLVTSSREQGRALAERLEATIARMEDELQGLQAKAMHPRSQPATARIMNSEKKTESLRLARCGEHQEKIAKVVGVSESEVELLLLVHGRSSPSTPSAHPTSAKSP